MLTINPALLLLVLLNLLGFVLMGLDKLQAQRNRWRIRERTLLGLACCFGAYGIYGGLKVFRHKTRHRSFTLFLPWLLVIQSLLIGWFYLK